MKANKSNTCGAADAVKVGTAGDGSLPAATAGGDSSKPQGMLSIQVSTPGSNRESTGQLDHNGIWPGDIVQNLTGGSYLVPPESHHNGYSLAKLGPNLGPVLDAITANVYGAGYKLVPVFDDLETPAGLERVRGILDYERSLDAGYDPLDADAPELPQVTDVEVANQVTAIKRRMAMESVALLSWLDRCGLEDGLQALNVLKGQDKEITGTGYLEVLRDSAGAPSKLVWAPAWSIRPEAQMHGEIEVTVEEPVTPLTWEFVTMPRRMRGYIQLAEGGRNVVAYYKEYGDPRIRSRYTGRYYAGTDTGLKSLQTDKAEVEAFKSRHSGVEPAVPLAATEILAFKLPYSGSRAYGKPSWSGVYPIEAGARELSEENRLVITDQKVPQGLLFVWGLRVSPEQIGKVEQAMNAGGDGARGIKIISGALASRAQSGAGVNAKFEFVPLKDAQHNDMLGVKMLQYGSQATRGAYRIPAVSVGQPDGADEGVAKVMLRLAEDQVYAPRRDLEDEVFNRHILPDLGIRLWRYKSCSRAPKDPEMVAKILQTLSTAAAISPQDARAIAEDIFNRKLTSASGWWNTLPKGLIVPLLQTNNQLTAAALLADEAGGANLLQDMLRADAARELAGAGAMPDAGTEAKDGQD